jgi:plasmid stabilization system protein ParE
VATLLFSERALADVARIADFPDEDSPASGEATVNLIIEALEILDRHPLIGRATAGEHRELVISQGRTGFLALYEYDEAHDRILINAVRHQREAGFEKM